MPSQWSDTASSTRILAMDTSQIQGGVALLQGEMPLVVSRFHSEKGHGTRLAVEVARLLAEVSWQIKDLEMIVVGLGPGSFTGVRIALGMAKALAWGGGIPLVGISSLDVLAASADHQGSTGLVLQDGRLGELFCALFQPDSAGNPVSVWPPRACSVAQLIGDLQELGWPPRSDPEPWICGDGWSLCADGFSAGFGRGAGQGFRVFAHSEVDPVWLGRLGWRSWLQHGPMDQILLDPLYLRCSQAEMTRTAKS